MDSRYRTQSRKSIQVDTSTVHTQVLLEHVDKSGERLLADDAQADVLDVVAARRDRLELRVQVEVQVAQHLRLHREARERRETLEERRQVVCTFIVTQTLYSNGSKFESETVTNSKCNSNLRLQTRTTNAPEAGSGGRALGDWRAKT